MTSKSKRQTAPATAPINRDCDSLTSETRPPIDFQPKSVKAFLAFPALFWEHHAIETNAPIVRTLRTSSQRKFTVGACPSLATATPFHPPPVAPPTTSPAQPSECPAKTKSLVRPPPQRPRVLSPAGEHPKDADQLEPIAPTSLSGEMRADSRRVQSLWEWHDLSWYYGAA